MISTRRDLYLIMISYSNQKEVMDLHDLAHFLENEQKVRTRLLKRQCGWDISPGDGREKNLKGEISQKNFFIAFSVMISWLQLPFCSIN